MTNGRKRVSARSERAKEPVQVYLDGADQIRLERLAARLNSTKSDVLRRGLESLERQLTDPSQHAAMRIIGLLADVPGLPNLGPDPAREIDRILADEEERSWHSERGSRHGA
jgi:hypothetical protein